ncbi:MAG TPA: hypothetical protein VD948_02565 [Rhodothermales bacterium]|nr:hypothetical protein [Rhodothermales bacterium]
MRTRLLTIFFGLCLLMPAAPASAQVTAPLRIMMDCQNTGCDMAFFRTELTFAEFVRDVADAHVQVLLTSQGNGAGGRTYTLRFLGQGALAGKNDELSVSTRASDTDDTSRRAILQALSAGLVSYAARLGRLERFRVVYDAPATTEAVAPERDPWNHWIFSVSASGNLDGQKRYRSRNLHYNASARRVTEQSKTSISANANDNVDVYVLSNGTEDKVRQTSLNGNARSVYSIGSNMAALLEANAYRSSFDNTARSLRVATGLEYDFFPYHESTRRLVTLRYQLGARHIVYEDTTIYNKIREALFDHRLALEADFQQPWGTLELSGSATQYLNHTEQYSLSANGEAEVRLFRGLSANVFAGVNLLRNQRNISGEGVSDDDIYTRRRALATGYSYYAGGGLSYTFGSALTGVVNPRFN